MGATESGTGMPVYCDIYKAVTSSPSALTLRQGAVHTHRLVHNDLVFTSVEHMHTHTHTRTHARTHTHTHRTHVSEIAYP